MGYDIFDEEMEIPDELWAYFTKEFDMEDNHEWWDDVDIGDTVELRTYNNTIVVSGVFTNYFGFSDDPYGDTGMVVTDFRGNDCYTDWREIIHIKKITVYDQIIIPSFERTT